VGFHQRARRGSWGLMRFPLAVSYHKNDNHDDGGDDDDNNDDNWCPPARPAVD
jgi:hypothetical protein